MIEKLQLAFKDIKYHDGQHRYFHSNGTELTSVTKFLGSLKPKFNSEFWSTLKAYEFSGYRVKSIWNDFTKFMIFYDPDSPHGEYVYLENDHSHLKVTPEDVLQQWSADSTIGKTRGTYVHNYLENLENRVTDVPKTEIPDGLETGQAINYFNSLKAAQGLCQDFAEYAKEKLILVAAEFTVGDPKLKLAGRFDRLYLNLETKMYEIWDFKTDNQIRYKSNFGKLKLFDLPDCEFEKYSLQTSLYKKMIQDATGIELGESKIVWFNLKENTWEIIQAKNYTSLIDSIDENNWLIHV